MKSLLKSRGLGNNNKRFAKVESCCGKEMAVSIANDNACCCRGPADRTIKVEFEVGGGRWLPGDKDGGRIQRGVVGEGGGGEW